MLRPTERAVHNRGLPTVHRGSMLLGLRTAPYAGPDLAAAKAWYAKVTGITPYFDEPFYVGFEVGSYELAIIENPHFKGGK